MMNRKGFIAIEILVIIIVFIISFGYVHMITVQAQNTNKQNLEYTTEIAEEYIKKIEVDRQFTEQTRVEILKKLDGKFSEINIESTEQKLNPGEYVYLRINVINKNMRGGNILNKTITAEGIAK